MRQWLKEDSHNRHECTRIDTLRMHHWTAHVQQISPLIVKQQCFFFEGRNYLEQCSTWYTKMKTWKRWLNYQYDRSRCNNAALLVSTCTFKCHHSHNKCRAIPSEAAVLSCWGARSSEFLSFSWSLCRSSCALEFLRCRKGSSVLSSFSCSWAVSFDMRNCCSHTWSAFCKVSTLRRSSCSRSADSSSFCSLAWSLLLELLSFLWSSIIGSVCFCNSTKLNIFWLTPSWDKDSFFWLVNQLCTVQLVWSFALP